MRSSSAVCRFNCVEIKKKMEILISLVLNSQRERLRPRSQASCSDKSISAIAGSLRSLAGKTGLEKIPAWKRNQKNGED
jgi:hypothetical protein